MLTSDDLKREIVDLRQHKRTGKWLGTCPFHYELTPSFHFDPETHTFHCFGCGVGGGSAEWFHELELKARREREKR